RVGLMNLSRILPRRFGLIPHSLPLILFRGTVYSNRGFSHGIQSYFDRAIADFTEAIRLQPTSAEGYLRRGQAHGGKGTHDKPIADPTEAIRLNPQLADAYFCRGIANNHLEEHQQAVSDFTHALSLQPKGIYYQLRATAYRALGEETKAAADEC